MLRDRYVVRVSNISADISRYQVEMAVDDYMSLEESVSKMIECLHTAEKEAMDPPAPSVQVSHRVKGRVCRNYIRLIM